MAANIANIYVCVGSVDLTKDEQQEILQEIRDMVADEKRASTQKSAIMMSSLGASLERWVYTEDDRGQRA